MRLHYQCFSCEKEQTWTCQLSGKLYHNHKLVSEATFPLAFGDELAIGDVTFKLYPEEFGVEGAQVIISSTRCIAMTFTRTIRVPQSPRIIYRVQKTRSYQSSGSGLQKPSDELLELIMPPLIMVGVTLLITIFQPRGSISSNSIHVCS
ncbi:MAG: hypothetical protein ACLROH_05885 [Streptococcus sp.]